MQEYDQRTIASDDRIDGPVLYLKLGVMKIHDSLALPECVLTGTVN